MHIKLSTDALLTLYSMPDLRRMEYASITIRFNGQDLDFEADWLEDVQREMRALHPQNKQQLVARVQAEQQRRHGLSIPPPTWLVED